jgi:tetratricopeptide (TPR) repeat protein
MRRAVAIEEESLGPKHPDVALLLNNLAVLLYETNRFTEAEPLMRRALAIDEQSFGPEHPNVLGKWNNLSFILRNIGNAEMAEPIDRRVIGTTKKVFGDIHPLTIHRRNNLTLTLIMLDKMEEANQILTENWRLNAHHHANTTPRIAFLQYIVAMLESRQNTIFLGRLKKLLTGPELPVTTDVAVPWDIAYFIEYLRPKLPPDSPDFLFALVAAMNDLGQVDKLNEFDIWKKQEPIPLE